MKDKTLPGRTKKAPDRDKAKKRTPVTVAVEGIDGSGKSVQFKLLRSRLEDAGYKVGELDFPCYGSFFGGEVGRYLAGDGDVSAKEVDVRSMSLWYAMDRFKAYEDFDAEQYDVVLLNRSTMANAAYQGSRVQIKAMEKGEDSQKALEEYIEWLFRLEFDVLGIPKPDIFFVFDVPVSVSKDNVAKKGRRDYVGGERADVYEKDDVLLNTVRQGYLTCAGMFSGVKVISCARASGKMRPIPEISDEIMGYLKELLP
jgi:dTMP kinase